MDSPKWGKHYLDPKTKANINSVQDLINHQTNCWKEQLTTQTFIPFEAFQICKIPLSLTPYIEDDTICWQGTKGGHYTVKFGYNAIMEWDNNNQDQGQSSQHAMLEMNWSKIWEQRNPPKQLQLIWRSLHNALPVKSNLITRGMLCDSLYPRCNQSPETVEHIFLKCEWAQRVWFSSPLTINRSNTQTHNFMDWEDGRCIGAVIMVAHGPNDATLAEASGLQEALSRIKTMNLRRVIIELDAIVIV
ncbi:hypothetical protein TSUD_282570 [Trifolium subterraneum]|uniref:Reverse transcriptase zinc-binding domain-containing protein n=1 Tax=Trifolium subterraneum TaxID=3900 RepID=A0A2Z6P7A7_TRISU|nr:hypothetical protein TSUD_282570 [Trifolium subterraneum]